MTTAVATPRDAFYARLDANTCADLQDAADIVKTGHVFVLMAAIKAGKRLIQVKQDYSGLFMEWCKVEFSFELSTAQNYMSAARAFPDLTEEQALLITSRAAYQLGKRDVKEDAPELAIELITAGHRVTREAAHALAYAPEYVRTGLLDGEYSDSEAYALTQAYRSVEPVVAAQCEAWQVRSPLAIETLNKRYTSETSTAWDDVIADNGQLDAGRWVKPLSLCDDDDVREWINARQALHIEENSAYVTLTDVTGYVDDNGQIVLTGSSLARLAGKQVKLTIKYKEVG